MTRSKEKGERLDEEQFAVKVAEEDIFQKVSSFDVSALIAHLSVANLWNLKL